MGVHRRKILSAVGASMALIGGLLAATALVGVVPAGAVTLWAPTTACGVFDTTTCLLYTSPSPRDRTRSRMPSSA